MHFSDSFFSKLSMSRNEFTFKWAKYCNLIFIITKLKQYISEKKEDEASDIKS